MTQQFLQILKNTEKSLEAASVLALWHDESLDDGIYSLLMENAHDPLLNSGYSMLDEKVKNPESHKSQENIWKLTWNLTEMPNTEVRFKEQKTWVTLGLVTRNWII